MENAVVYARYSSGNQTEQSIEGQLAAAKIYAEQKGYRIVKEYCDRAKTGTNDNREAFQQMLKDTAKKKFSVIIVWKVDRFGRNREEITFNKYKAKKNGVRVEYVAENISTGPEGVILESVLEGMAEYFSLQLSQNIRRGQLEAAKKHHAVSGSVPFGYKVGSDKKYHIDPETAPTVQLIFNLYVDGATLTEIPNIIKAKGYKHTNRKFSKTMLEKMLKNERYKGIYIFKDLIRDENAFDRIIDDETFDKAQEMMRMNKRMPSHKWSYSDYALTNKLFCGKCGAPMVGMSGYGKHKVKYHYYVCLNHHKEKTCDKKNIRQEAIESAVLEAARSLLADDVLLENIIDMVWEYYTEHDEYRDERNRLQKALRAAQKARDNLLKAVEQGMPYEDVRGRIEELKDEIESHEQKISQIEVESLHLTRDHIEFFLEQYREFKYEDRESQKRLIRTFVNSVHLYDDHAVLALNYSGDDNTITLNDVNSVRTWNTSCSKDASIRTRICKNVILLKISLTKN